MQGKKRLLRPERRLLVASQRKENVTGVMERLEKRFPSKLIEAHYRLVASAAKNARHSRPVDWAAVDQSIVFFEQYQKELEKAGIASLKGIRSAYRAGKMSRKDAQELRATITSNIQEVHTLLTNTILFRNQGQN